MSEAAGGIIGGVLGIFGTAIENRAVEQAATENYEFYRQGAIEEGVAALDREQVRRTQLREALGQQVVGVAKSGVSFTGSVILALNESILRGEQDMLALKRQGEQQVSDFLRAASGEWQIASTARKLGFLKTARSASNTYSNISRSQQPTNRSTTQSRGTDDRVNSQDRTTNDAGDEYGTIEGN